MSHQEFDREFVCEGRDHIEGKGVKCTFIYSGPEAEDALCVHKTSRLSPLGLDLLTSLRVT
jgi:hypothetical protein